MESLEQSTPLRKPTSFRNGRISTSEGNSSGCRKYCYPLEETQLCIQMAMMVSPGTAQVCSSMHAQNLPLRGSHGPHSKGRFRERTNQSAHCCSWSQNSSQCSRLPPPLPTAHCPPPQPGTLKTQKIPVCSCQPQRRVSHPRKHFYHYCVLNCPRISYAVQHCHFHTTDFYP